MALLKFLFDRRHETMPRSRGAAISYESPEAIGPQCRNPNCITSKEPLSAPKRFELFAIGESGSVIFGCKYCDHPFKGQYLRNVAPKSYFSYDNTPARNLKEALKKDEVGIFHSLKKAQELRAQPF